MSADHQQIRHALRQLGFEVAFADSVLIGDQPVAIADIARHGLPLGAGDVFSLDAGPTPPSPGGGYPLPQPPIGTAMPTPRRKHLPQIPPRRPAPPMEEMTVEDLWGDSSVWGESNVEGDDTEFVDPFEAGFRDDKDIDGESSMISKDDVEDATPDDGSSTLIVWVPEEISRRLVELLGGEGSKASRDPQVLLKLIGMLRELQSGAPGATVGEGSDAGDGGQSAAGFLASLEERLRDSLTDQDPLESSDD